MRGRDDPEFFSQAKCLVEFLVGDSQRAFVSQENFETAYAAFDDLHELLFGGVVVARHAHVKAEVAGAVPLRLAQPHPEGRQRFAPPPPADPLTEWSLAA